MKAAFASVLVLLAASVGMGQADTNTATTGSCSLSGPIEAASTECQALRQTFRAKVGTCMETLKVDADRRAGTSALGNSHSSRARYLLCAAEVQKTLALGAP